MNNVRSKAGLARCVCVCVCVCGGSGEARKIGMSQVDGSED